jgi:hypothetical protein
MDLSSGRAGREPPPDKQQDGNIVKNVVKDCMINGLKDGGSIM